MDRDLKLTIHANYKGNASDSLLKLTGVLDRLNKGLSTLQQRTGGIGQSFETMLCSASRSLDSLNAKLGETAKLTAAVGGDSQLRILPLGPIASGALGRGRSGIAGEGGSSALPIAKQLEATAKSASTLEGAFDKMAASSSKTFKDLSGAARHAGQALEGIHRKAAGIDLGGSSRAGRFDQGIHLPKGLPLGAAGLAAGEMTAVLALAGKIGDVITKAIPGQRLEEYNTSPGTTFGISKAAKSRREVETRAGVRDNLLDWIPGFSGFLATAKHADYVNSDAFRIEQGLRDREQTMRINLARASNMSQRDIRMQQLGAEETRFKALSQLGVNSASQSARIWEGGQGALDIGLRRIQGGGAGYDRASAMRDFAGTIAHGVSLAQHDAEARRQVGITTQERTAAGKATATARGRLTDQQKALELARRDVGRGGGDEESQARRRMAYEEQLFRVKEAQRVLEDAMGKERQLAIQQSEQLNTLGQRRLAIQQQEAERLRSIAREERERETGRREQFGLLHPRRQMSFLALGRKLQQGLPMTTRDIEMMQSAPGNMFGERLRQIGMQRTGAGSAYAQLAGLLPELRARRQQAEKALAAVNQNFHVEIKLNEKAVADQLLREVMPKITQAVRGVKLHFAIERDRQMNQLWLNHNAQFRGG